MTPDQFIEKWSRSALKESAAAKEHFLDLCALLHQPTPAQADPDGDWYTFEKGAGKAGGGDGFADVWRKGCFAWEYKGPNKDLNLAYGQLVKYAGDLENPPLLVVSDTKLIRIYTSFTNTTQRKIEIPLETINQPAQLDILRRIFEDPESLNPALTAAKLTTEAAATVAELAEALRNRGIDPARTAHFLMQTMFCFYAEDAGLLPGKLLTRVLDVTHKRPEFFARQFTALFETMRTGGFFGPEEIEYFNGGLFEASDPPALDRREIAILIKAARLDWTAIEPSIFGTLFERGLDPAKRSQLGAHYTDRASILRILEPVLFTPVRAQWAAARERLAATKSPKAARELFEEFLEQLRATVVLDPACGSGNFLYLALLGLKDLEFQILLEAERDFHLPRIFPAIGPRNVAGLELSPYAAELAMVTIWIGQIQWDLKSSGGYARNPILDTLERIECRDALINADGTESVWPAATVIVGNPPFLGDKKMISELGEEYVTRLRKLFDRRVPGGADLVCYWFEKSRAQIEAGQARRAGLVATNSIRGGQNRKVLERIRESGNIFHAWSDQEWVVEGAAVRVSLVCFANDADLPVALDGLPVAEVFADLTAAQNLVSAQPLRENAGLSHIGVQNNGPFDIPGERARSWLQLPCNPNGCPNSEVLRPRRNALDVVRQSSDTWLIDFGDRDQSEAELYEAPFEFVLTTVKPIRDDQRRESRRRQYWRLGENQFRMRRAIAPISRYLATPRIAKHRLFVWLESSILPDCQLVVIARDDDTTFGILHSRFHELWSLALCTWLGVGNDPRYTPSSTFETFPFPDGLTPNIPAPQYADDPRAIAIAAAARTLTQLRDRWLNPPELVNVVPEVVPGYPDRLIPKSVEAASELKKRTLTNLYNAKPAWLRNAHAQLDSAVAAAYGWPANLPDDEILRLLLALNHARAAQPAPPAPPSGDALD